MAQLRYTHARTNQNNNHNQISISNRDPQKAQRHVGIPRKRSAMWGSSGSAAPCGDPQKAQRDLEIPRKRSAVGDSQKALRYLQIGALFENSQKAQIPRKRGTYIYIYIYIYICMYVCMSVCIYVYFSIYQVPSTKATVSELQSRRSLK